MRMHRPAAVTIGLILLSGCTSNAQHGTGDAAPAGSPAPATPTTVISAAGSPTPGTSAGAPTIGAPATAPPTTGGTQPIRAVDWKNLEFEFINSDPIYKFHNGVSTSTGETCTMLPNGAKAVYANLQDTSKPYGEVMGAGEEALIVIHCSLNDDDMLAVVAMYGDGPMGSPMGTNIVEDLQHGRITSYQVSGGKIVATERTADGKTATRRYSRDKNQNYVLDPNTP